MFMNLDAGERKQRLTLNSRGPQLTSITVAGENIVPACLPVFSTEGWHC